MNKDCQESSDPDFSDSQYSGSWMLVRCFILVFIVISQVCVVLSGESEPDWTNRREEIRRQLLQTFRPPSIGSTVTIERTIGGNYTGRLDAASATSIVVDGTQYTARQLTTRARTTFFSDAYAATSAQEQVAQEYRAFKDRQAKEAQAQQQPAKTATTAQRTDLSQLGVESKTESPPPGNPLTSAHNGADSAKNASTDNVSGVYVLIGIALGYWVLKWLRKAIKVREAKAFIARVKANNGLSPINASLMLQRGEKAYMEASTELYETRAVRVHQGGWLSFRLTRRISVGRAAGVSRSLPQMTRIDTGRMILTNKRLCFEGRIESRTIAIGKIVSIHPFLDGMEVTSESRQKSMYFKVPNPLVWAATVRILSGVDNPEDLTGINLKFDFN